MPCFVKFEKENPAKWQGSLFFLFSCHTPRHCEERSNLCEVNLYRLPRRYATRNDEVSGQPKQPYRLGVQFPLQSHL